MKLLVLVGSLRAGSTNRRLAEAAIAHLPAGIEAEIYSGLGELPHYNEDVDTHDVPTSVAMFRAAVADADALLVVTPEYNGSMSGVLKNAIDWASRPRGTAALAGKLTAVLAATGAQRNGVWARQDAVRTLKVAGADVIADTVGIAQSWQAFDGEGHLIDSDIDSELRELVQRLAKDAAQAA